MNLFKYLLLLLLSPLFLTLFLSGCSTSDYSQPKDFMGLSGSASEKAQLSYAKARLMWPSLTRMDNIDPEKSTNPIGAIELLTKAIALEPSFAEAYALRALAKSDCEDHRGAISDLNIALNFSDDYKFLAYRALVLTRAKQYTDAQKDLDASLSRNSSQAYAWKYQGLLNEDLGNIDEACKDYEKACSYGDCSAWNRAIIASRCSR